MIIDYTGLIAGDWTRLISDLTVNMHTTGHYTVCNYKCVLYIPQHVASRCALSLSAV